MSDDGTDELAASVKPVFVPFRGRRNFQVSQVIGSGVYIDVGGQDLLVPRLYPSFLPLPSVGDWVVVDNYDGSPLILGPAG